MVESEDRVDHQVKHPTAHPLVGFLHRKHRIFIVIITLIIEMAVVVGVAREEVIQGPEYDIVQEVLWVFL